MRDFNHTVNVLVRSYMDGSLQHGDCAACAVGNIIADSIGAKVYTDQLFGGSWKRGGCEITIVWDEVFLTSPGRTQDITPDAYKGWVKKQIDASGYSWEELARIEKAFESVPYDDHSYNSDSHMFDGLMAVVDVLAEIHGIDLKQKEEAKALFIKA